MEIKVTLDQLHKVAQDIIQKAKSTKTDTATVITLEGDLGSGKTTLTQEISKILGVKESVISPTFVIMKKYEVVDDIFKHLIHIDAYRLNESKELINLGWGNILADKTNLIIIEWPSQVPECIPAHACKLELKHAKDDTRVITFHY